MIKSKFIIFFLGIFFFNSCVSATAKLKENWYDNPPADNELYFYGIGYGDNLEEAKRDALSQISSKISVNVASSFNSSVTANRIGDDEEVIKTTKNEVIAKSKSIEYTDVKVVKSTTIDGQKVVLVEVNREELLENYLRKLNKIDNEIKLQWSFFKEANNPFEKLKIASKIDKLLKQTDSIFPLLHILSVRFDDSKYLKRYQNYTKEIQKVKNNLKVKIVSDENSKPLAELIAEYLSNEGVKISPNYDVIIKISTKAKKRKYKSTNEKFKKLTFALRKTTIVVYDKNGNIISNTIYKTKEASPNGFKDALYKTTKYENKIKQKGVIDFIIGK